MGMKYLLATILSFSMAVSALNLYADQSTLRVGVIDFAEVLMRSPYGKLMSMELGKDKQSMARKINLQDRAIYQLLLLQRSNSSDDFSPERSKLLSKQINKKKHTLELEKQLIAQKFRQQESSYIAEHFLPKLQQVFPQIVEQYNLNLILKKNQLLAFREQEELELVEIDITMEALRALVSLNEREQ